MGTFDRILVAVDGVGSDAAVDAAAALAAHSGGEVLALHVLTRDAPCRGPSAADCGLREDDESLANAISRLQEAGIRCRGESWRTIDGRVMEAVLAAADEYDANLVIVGNRSRRGLLGLLRTGLGPRLARSCRRPVLLVP